MPSLRLAVLISILLCGLLLRVDSAWEGADIQMPDSAAYERIARGIADDGVFAERGPGAPVHRQAASNYSPGLPLLIAAWHRLTGDDDARSARLMLALISALAIPFAWMLAGRLSPSAFRLPAEVAAAAVIAFYPVMIADAGMFLTEPLTGTLIIGALLAMLRARDQPPAPARWILPGVLFGLTALVRPEYLTIGLVAAAVLLLTCGMGPRRAGGPALVLVLAFGVVVGPWMVHAGREAGRPVPVSTGGGQTFFTGSVLESGGDPQRVVPGLLARHPGVAARLARQNRVSGEGADSVTPERVLALLAGRRHPDLPTDLALSRMARQNYLEALRSEPVRLAGFLASKSIRVWWRGRRDLTGEIPGRTIHWLITGLAAVGLLLLAGRRRRELWPILALTVGATLVGAVLVASPRRSLALWPLVASLSGVGAAGLIAAARAALGFRSRRDVRVA